MSEETGIISSIIDNDLYKMTMQQAVVQLFPKSYVKYKFINRGKTEFPDGFDIRLRQELKKMEGLSLETKEADFLTRKCGDFLNPTYIDFLKSYRYDSTEVGIKQDGGDLDIDITGYWYKTILWEVPLMALISELYFEMTGEVYYDREERKSNNLSKGKKFYTHSMSVADFGTRRRFSYDNQFEVVNDLKNHTFGGNDFLVGTSNVHIAMKLDLQPIGTHAHEWFMFHAVEYGYTRANFRALENWVEVYKGSLGIALPDTHTAEVFFRTFDKMFAKLFDGVRHDSGCPFRFADKVVAHYNSLGINPATKTIVFSDGLNTDLAVELYDYCREVGIMCSFGIGTHFTNDVGVKALNMVIKIVQVKVDGMWIDTVKLSDNPVKHTGTKEEIKLCKDTLRIKERKSVEIA